MRDHLLPLLKLLRGTSSHPHALFRVAQFPVWRATSAGGLQCVECALQPPLGNHPHAVTAIGSVYQASYDAAGEMTCRAPGSGVTCSGSSPNGQTMTYDAERQLAHWQNTPSSPATQDDFLYDGSGQRVMQYVNVNGVITTTAYMSHSRWKPEVRVGADFCTFHLYTFGGALNY